MDLVNIIIYFWALKIKIWQLVIQDGRQKQKWAYFNEILFDFDDISIKL